MLVKGLSGAEGRLLVRERGTAEASATTRSIGKPSTARALACSPIPASGSEEIGRTEVFFDVTLPPPELS